MYIYWGIIYFLCVIPSYYILVSSGMSGDYKNFAKPNAKIIYPISRSLPLAAVNSWWSEEYADEMLQKDPSRIFLKYVGIPFYLNSGLVLVITN